MELVRTSQLRTLRSIFQQMDQDNDGRVSLAEFKLHVRDSTLEKMAQGVWRRLDHSGCGLMSFRSLLKVMYPAAKRSDIRAMLVMARGYEHRHVFPMRLTVDQMKQVFAAHDDDHSGTIEIKEFVALLSNAVVDGDNSGCITVIEFMRWYTRLCEKAEAAAAQLKEQLDEDDGGSQSEDDDDDTAPQSSPSEISARKALERMQVLGGVTQQLGQFDPHWHIPP
ncbi:hypothetical protein WJX84_006762 [Apatococcus fuscideae]|uniref:EF-hand domain-containing protein n=1 Tax=Apatococcus fuscideae TaxID=2026836 RepID=A0AAW1T228_9CHLO